MQSLRDLNPESSALYGYTGWDWFTGPRSGADFAARPCADDLPLSLVTAVA